MVSRQWSVVSKSEQLIGLVYMIKNKIKKIKFVIEQLQTISLLTTDHCLLTTTNEPL